MQIKGSDTIVNLVQVLVENFVKRNPSFNVSVTGGGSGTGFASLINGTCDIVMSSREIDDKEKILAKSKNIIPIEFRIGLDGLAVLVNKNNPVDKLTLEQLRSIFMAEILNWKEFGWENKRIVILSRESNSGTHMFFKVRVLRNNNRNAKDEFAVKSLMMPSSQAIYDEVSQNFNAIGYVGMGFANDKVKTVSVAVNNFSDYVYPTLESVTNGSYPISRVLYLYTSGIPQGIVKMFIDYVTSDVGQKIVLETDFVPIRYCNGDVGV
jgi:phosphate transport system substrate-binding protein